MRSSPCAPRRNRWGFTAGFVVGALNPQYLFSWSAIVAIAVSVAGLQPSMLDRVVFPCSGRGRCHVRIHVPCSVSAAAPQMAGPRYESCCGGWAYCSSRWHVARRPAHGQ